NKMARGGKMAGIVREPGWAPLLPRNATAIGDGLNKRKFNTVLVKKFIDAVSRRKFCLYRPPFLYNGGMLRLDINFNGSFTRSALYYNLFCGIFFFLFLPPGSHADSR